MGIVSGVLFTTDVLPIIAFILAESSSTDLFTTSYREISVPGASMGAFSLIEVKSLSETLFLIYAGESS